MIVNLIWLHIVQAHTCSHISSASTLYMSWASTQCALQFLCDATSNFRTDFCMERLCSFRRSTVRRECPWSQYKICIFLSYFRQQKSPVLSNRALCIILHLPALLSHQFQPPKRVSPPRYIPLSSARNRSDILCKCLPLYRRQ